MAQAGLPSKTGAKTKEKIKNSTPDIGTARMSGRERPQDITRLDRHKGSEYTQGENEVEKGSGLLLPLAFRV